MDKQLANALNEAAYKEVQATRRFMRFLDDQNTAGNEVAAFDSMLASNADGREAAFLQLPESLQRILSNDYIKQNPQPVFDGIAEGIEEFKYRNGGEEPSAYALAAALSTAAIPFGGGSKQDPNEKNTFDSLSLGHHEALSVVPAATQVVIAYGISNSLPLVTMLPNPTGSNELPIVYGTTVAGTNMGVMRIGDRMDGDKAGMPYLENRHVLMMEAGAGAGEFVLESHAAYTMEVAANKTTRFKVDKSSQIAPFLGGRVVVMVKGVEIANDKNRNHPTNKGKSILQSAEPLVLGADKFILKSGVADLDTHEVTVTFDTTDGATPEVGDVTVELIFDYERKDSNNKKILTEPSTDVEFSHHSIYAFPSRSRSTATIDAITQLSNELGINWYAAAQTVAMQRYYFEQTSRLLRTAVNMCYANQDPKTGRVITFDFKKDGISPTKIADAFSNVNITLGLARTRLSTAINTAIGGYDLYVSDRGAAFFSGLGGENYEETGVAFGDQYSVYRIGRLKSSNANVYYVPASMGVFNESADLTTAFALIVPRPIQPAQAQFVGMIAVPPMVLTSKADAFEEDIAIYSRMAADANPIPRYRNQCMILEMINLPAL